MAVQRRTTQGIVVARAVAGWMRANPVIVSGVLVAAVTAVAWSALDSFYGTLGVAPQEVGAGVAIQSLIVSVGILLLYLVLESVILLAVLGLGLVALFAILDSARIFRATARGEADVATSLRRRTTEFRDNMDTAWALATVLAVLVLGFAVYLVLSAAQQDAALVRQGVTLKPGKVGPIPGALYSAEAVEVDKTGSSAPLSNTDCLLLLGSADGTSVLFDASTDTSVRVATAAVELRAPAARTTAACLRRLKSSKPVVVSGNLLSDSDRLSYGLAFCLLGLPLIVLGSAILRMRRSTAAGAAGTRDWTTAHRLGLGDVFLGLLLLAAGVPLFVGPLQLSELSLYGALGCFAVVLVGLLADVYQEA